MKLPSTKQLSQSDKLNGLRAAVLGANDGIVSTSGLIFGVAGATNNKAAIFTAGLAGLVAGAISMGLGEYVSVSTQRDTERAFIEREKELLNKDPEGQLQDLAAFYENKGVSTATAMQFAKELTEGDPIKAHLEAELKLDEEDLTNPMTAAVSSFFSFTAGALIPLLAAVAASDAMRIKVTLIAVVIGLFATGYYSAAIGGANKPAAVRRVIIGGIVAMAVTYAIGRLFGTAI
ncbi:VIT family protein, partial [Candidatus Saccharibacteria bacterium]|nr:VIT family protein [Candidatus Saccharibacteria bacterium]